MPFETNQHTPGNLARMPHSTTPANRPYRVALIYKNFKTAIGSNHIGLGVTALHTSKFLRAKGIYTDVWGVTNLDGLKQKLVEAQGNPPNIHPVTHVVISAPWLSSEDLQDLAILNPHITFACTSHSNISFLAADPSAFRLVKEYMLVERSTPNFHVAGNSARLAKWVTSVHASPCWTIPNLYYLDGSVTPHRQMFTGDTIRIGCFGATRILKNILTAGAAALDIASSLRVNLEFWISGGREEGAQGTLDALAQMFDGLHYARICKQPWQEWAAFRQTVRHMHLMLQPSFTETFNVVTADGIAEGVPSVVSTAIYWTPKDWQADSDDATAIAQVGRRLLADPGAPVDGLNALAEYNKSAFGEWQKFLNDTSPHM